MASSRSHSTLPPSQPKPDSLVGYPGSKGASGVAERIIRQMPPHSTYIEAFAGYAAVYRKKLPADRSILIDRDAKCCHRLRSHIANRADGARVEILHGCSLEILPSLPAVQAFDTVLFVDPPYLLDVRTKKDLYDFEFERKLHVGLLDMMKGLGCKVLITHYRHPLYETKLKRWRMIEIPAMTRGGQRFECLWCNFPEPETLHDPRFAGGGYRERELVKKKKKRWAAKFEAMDPRHRQAVAAALVEVDRAAVESAMRLLTPGMPMPPIDKP